MKLIPINIALVIAPDLVKRIGREEYEKADK